MKNEARRIHKILEALARQTLKPAEIIVVDGHSTDGTVEVAKRFGVRIFYEEDRTRAGACQVGVLKAIGDYVAFTDADCLPEPDWLARLHAGFAPGIAGVGGRVENRGETFWQHAVDEALDTFLGSANSVQGRPFRDRRHVTSISGSNSMYRRTDLLSAGGFRRELVTTEDTELNRRMLEQGKLLYVPDAVVHHRHERGLRDFGRRMIQYGYGRGQSRLPGAPIAVAISPPFVLAILVLSPWYGLALVSAYLAALVGSAIRPSIRKKKAGLLLAIPAVLLIEHTCYALGFWKGLLVRRERPRIAASGRDPA